MAGNDLDKEESGGEEEDRVQLDRLQPSEPLFHSHDPIRAARSRDLADGCGCRSNDIERETMSTINIEATPI